MNIPHLVIPKVDGERPLSHMVENGTPQDLTRNMLYKASGNHEMTKYIQTGSRRRCIVFVKVILISSFSFHG